MENKELFLDLVEKLRKLNLSPEELSRRIANALPLLYEEVLQDHKDYVIKRSGLLEEFSPQKIKGSISGASDDSKNPLGEAELNLLVKEIAKAALEHGRVIYSKNLRDLVLEHLYKNKYYEVYKAFKEHE